MAAATRSQNVDGTIAGGVLPEFGPVRLLRDIVYYGTRFPEGTVGIVVEVHSGGAGYEVEFSTPAEEVVGLRREDLQAI